jgi:hypothetical protein
MPRPVKHHCHSPTPRYRRCTASSSGPRPAIEIHELVLPSHRPPWAESYAGKVMLSTQPGSFILNLALPLVADIGNESSDGEQLAFQLPPQPFGRRVSTRMLKSAQAAQKLADEVSAGDRPSYCG